MRGWEWQAMLNYLKKFAMDIFPSVAATIIGAYIVNHYIVAKPDAPAAAVTTPAAAKPTEVSNAPEAGVKAKGMSERTLMERSASEKASVTEKPAEKSADLKPSVDSPAETASIPTDQRRHPPATPKAIAKLTPAATTPAAPAEATATPDESRDANDLARAAIERLRKEPAQRPQDAARSQEAQRPAEVARAPAPEAPHVVVAPSLKPLPPPIMVSNPASETAEQPSQPRAPYAQDPNRPTPPAEIPVAPRPPLDLRAEASMPAPKEERTSVADDMLSSMKSVFHSVLPK
jgi:hypothetical protein